MSSWKQVQIEGSQEQASFNCRVKPNAHETEVTGPYGKRVKIAVNKPAKDGQANDRLIAYLSELFRVDKHFIEITSGTSSPDKRIRVHGRKPSVVRKLLKQSTNKREGI